MAPRHSSSKAHDPQAGVHLREWGAELLGTAILLAAGLSAICASFAPGSPLQALLPSASLRLLLTGLCFAGSGSLVAVSPLGRLSGGHLNPCVTLGFWLRRMVHPHDLAGYIAAQVVGAGLGTAAATLVWGPSLRAVACGATVPGRNVSTLAAAALEAAMTALLVGTILLLVSNPRTLRLTPLAVWILAAAMVWQGAPFTGTGLNPARSLWPNLCAGRLDVYWAYVVGPVGGTLLAATCSRLASGRLGPRTAKLFHDPSYPSVFRTRGPGM